MDIGVPDIKAFLPKKNTNPEVQLGKLKVLSKIQF